MKGPFFGWICGAVLTGRVCRADRGCAPLQVGVNASSEVILDRLIRFDTASAFNITAEDVNVTGPEKSLNIYPCRKRLNPKS